MAIKKIQSNLPIKYVEDEAYEKVKEKNFFLKKIIRKSIFQFFKKNKWIEDENLKIDNLLKNEESIKKNRNKNWIDIVFKKVLITIASMFGMWKIMLFFKSFPESDTAILSSVLFLFLMIYWIVFYSSLIVEIISDYEFNNDLVVYLEDEEYSQKKWYQKLFSKKYKPVNFLSFCLSNLIFKNKRFKQLWISQYFLIYNDDLLKIPFEKNQSNKEERMQNLKKFLDKKISNVSID